MSNLKEKNLDFFNKILKKIKEKQKVQKKIEKENKYEFDDLSLLPKEPKVKITQAPKQPKVKEPGKRGRKKTRTKEDIAAYSRAYNKARREKDVKPIRPYKKGKGVFGTGKARSEMSLEEWREARTKYEKEWRLANAERVEACKEKQKKKKQNNA
jgi:hypothetical protein